MKFKVGDRVRVVSNIKVLCNRCYALDCSGLTGVYEKGSSDFPHRVRFDGGQTHYKSCSYRDGWLTLERNKELI